MSKINLYQELSIQRLYREILDIILEEIRKSTDNAKEWNNIEKSVNKAADETSLRKKKTVREETYFFRMKK